MILVFKTYRIDLLTQRIPSNRNAKPAMKARISGRFSVNCETKEATKPPTKSPVWDSSNVVGGTKGES